MIGASGGPRIISGVAEVMMRHLWIRENVKEAIEAARVHHQFLPMKVTAEVGVPEVSVISRNIHLLCKGEASSLYGRPPV